jgi:putative FmdB family regulatory protein
MPIYEYRCEACEHEFQAMRRITDDTLPGCPACESEDVRKKVSLSAFHLKGSGWYLTDYARKGEGKGEEEAGATKTDGGAEKKATESKTKPDVKPEKAKPSDKPAAAVG